MTSPDRGLLAAILRDPRLAHAGQGRDPWDSLEDALLRIWEALVGNNAAIGAARGIRFVFLGLVSIALVWGVWRLLHRLHHARQASRPASRLPGMRARAAAGRMDPGIHLEAALLARAGGASREAARQWLLYLISALDHTPSFLHGPTRTNQELSAALEAADAPQDLVQATHTFVSHFDPLWYSGAPFEDEVLDLLQQTAGLVFKSSQAPPPRLAPDSQPSGER